MRTPEHRPHGLSRKEFAKFQAQVVMAVLGLSHTYNTKVGNDFVRGVSGGERKRVSVAEMMLAGSPFASWDNSTRGLDSATALKFVQALRTSSDLTGGAAAVAIYQASQSVYDLFDKAAVLYEGRQIYFGPANQAKTYFERQGWYCPPRQTTGDFLTAVTNPQERKPRKGMENAVPRTPDDFERYWRESPEYKRLMEEIDDFEQEFPVDEHKTLEQLRQQKNYIQAKHARPKSPYLISIPMQVKLNTVRAYQRIWGDMASTVTQALLNIVMALIVGSIYFGHSPGTSSFQGRGAVLFLAILFNALTTLVSKSCSDELGPHLEHQTADEMLGRNQRTLRPTRDCRETQLLRLLSPVYRSRGRHRRRHTGQVPPSCCFQHNSVLSGRVAVHSRAVLLVLP